MNWKLPFIGQNNKQEKALVPQRTAPVSVFPDDPGELANFLRDTLARHYRLATKRVFVTNSIYGKAPDVNLYVAPRYVGLGVELSNPTLEIIRKAERLTKAIGIAAGLGDGTVDPPVEAVYVGNLLVYRFALPEYQFVRGRKIRMWSDVMLDSPLLQGEMAVGLLANSQQVFIELSDISPNFLVCGVQGSGKTGLMKTMAFQMMKWYTPEQVRIAFADLKGDFEIFRDEAHLLWQPAHTFGEIKALVYQFQVELARRMRVYVKDRTGLAGEPRWVLFIDEADHKDLLKDKENQERLLDVAMRGRFYKLHLVVGTHRPDDDSIGDVGKELTTKFLGQQASASASGQVEGGLALHKLSGQGDFYYARGRDPQRFQVAMVPDSWWSRLNRVSNVPELPMEAPTANINLISYDRKANGRPKFEIKAQDVVYYLVHGPDLVTVDEAKQVLGLSRDTGHLKTQQFARELLDAWEQAQGSKINFNLNEKVEVLK